ncbi:N-6 DNA methylase [Campylobacter upsaliensis]|uniref:N-6 DNA methylase n=1 Tax=Campylobacter upsaliensis TaxID=28080 RepID=UPI0022EA6E04|nr:N-6 DNA methylase [Campylobacter upsaliensis]
MIAKDNLKEALEILGFKPKGHIYTKTYTNDTKIEVNFTTQKINYYPLDSNFKEGQYPNIDNPSKGFIIHRNTTTNFSSNENFVCLLCVDALLTKGYKAKHIILEPTFEAGRNQQVYGDILVLNQNYENLILIENKTYGAEFSKEWNKTEKNGGQLFSYYAVNKTPFLCLLAYDFDENLKKIFYKSHIITMKDNEKYLEFINENLKKDEQKIGFNHELNRNKKDYFNVWSQSYSQSYTSKGLLEEDVLPYVVGKEKYTTKDLEIVPYSEISSIYHAFATILRNHAIGNYENTFYILVDLFLCKIVDERANPNNLQFYYKGLMYDSAFDYVDRLLNLHEIGIKDLFGKRVVNFKKGEIDKIFDKHERRKNGLKADLDKLFDKQKYFGMKKFSFIEVENEEEFQLNFKILTKITNLIQDFYISQSENNQFLGDLFEGFLNKSIHQTEGRFFTPTPITNFIIHSLPHLQDDIKVLDFACGAGHFLTEFITHKSEAKLYGIEKNKDLSKVAKTACLLHNAKEAQVIFQDALDEIKESDKKDFENESFDLILSNPPYSVKGFLSTLEESVLKNFTLSSAVENHYKNNAIECFFIEKAKQFLKPNALLVLVLPVSILQKGGIYEKTREVLFENFQILSIVEMSSRTFGSTGTQTIILFAKRMEKPYATKLINILKENAFDDEILQREYGSSEKKDIIYKYCDFMAYDYADFKDFMSGLPLSENLKNNEIFKEYLSDFSTTKPKKFKKQKLKDFEKKALFDTYLKQKQEAIKDTKAYNKAYRDFKESKDYKELEKALHYEKFLENVRAFECEKMHSFILIENEKILILKAPDNKTTDNKSNKANIIKFLGYDWSKRKGDEGIKYQTTIQDIENTELKESEDDSDEDKKQKEALRNINSVKFINTPLYNPQNPSDPTKLCYAIKSFIESSAKIDSIINALQSDDKDFYKLFISDMKAMLDFNKVDFNKAISLNPINSQGEGKTQNPFENCKFELVRISELMQDSEIALDIQSAKRPKGGVGNYTEGALSLGGEHIDNKSGYVKMQTPKYVPMEFYEDFKKADKGIVRKNDILLCKDGALTGKVALVRDEFENQSVMINEHIFLLRCQNSTTQKFLFFILHSQSGQSILKSKVTGSAQGGLSLSNLKDMKIPKPDIKIQKQIVSECEKVEEQYNTIRMSIEKYQELIRAILVKCGIVDSSE